jgi:hypothetical protein
MDPFTLLGVKPGDSEADLARAYRRKMFDAHPDRGGDDARARALSAAYEELRAQIVDGRLVVSRPTPPVMPGVRVRHQGVQVIFTVVNMPDFWSTTTSSMGSW